MLFGSDEVAARALRIEIHIDALSRAGRVRERVRIVMVQLPVPKDSTRVSAAATTSNTGAIEAINLRRVAVIDAPGYLDRRA
jgi:hypothetical protein